MMSFPITAATGCHDLGDGFVSGPPERRAETSDHSGCLDFPGSAGDVQATVPRQAVIREVRRIVDICRAGGDDRASAQVGFWNQTLAGLCRDTAGALGGPCLEELRWHYLQFSRRNDPSWWPLCAQIEEHFHLKDQLEALLRRYRSPDEAGAAKSEIRERYEAVLAASLAEAQDLHAERLRLSGGAAPRTAGDLTPSDRPGRLASPRARSLQPSAPPLSMHFPSRLTPTAPPMSSSWFYENRIAPPPTDISDPRKPSTDPTASRP